MYNGKYEYPEKTALSLSDLFKVKNGEINALELIVTVYNVNKGHNEKILKQSKTLNEYAAFIAKVREYKEAGGFESKEAVDRAIKDCVRKNILREFLEKYGGDVVSILYREFNIDDFVRVRTEEAAEDRAESIAENLLKKGMSKEFVAESTELSMKQIEKIMKKYNENK